MKEFIHVLARGIILDGDQVLLVHAKGESNTFLPGGHVEVGESFSQALNREVREEIGFACSVTGYLGVVEHQWAEGDRQQHEVNHVFTASVPGISSRETPLSREDHLEFLWVRVSELAGHHLLPSAVIGFIQRHMHGERGPFWANTFEV